MTNRHFDLCRERGKDAPFGLAGPSQRTGRLTLLARDGDPGELIKRAPRGVCGDFKIEGWDSSKPQTVGDYTVFRVTDQNSRPKFDRPNQPRIDLDLYDSLWAADVLFPGGRLLTHDEWDLVSGVTQGILCATRSQRLSREEAHYDAEATADVGSYPDFNGFYDLIGNVCERVMPDRIGDSPVRGWGWSDNPDGVRVSACRGGGRPGSRGGVGLRVAVVPQDS